MARTPISKKTRFEVFKRDKFTCQYCGAQAPEVILEIDHIMPVSKGGNNGIMNLITSCRNCNRGKTNKELSDDSTVKVQKQTLDDIQERRNQLKMMLEWRNALEDELDIEVESINDLIEKYTKYGLSETGKTNVKKVIKRFGFNETYKSCEIAIDKYYHNTSSSLNNAINKIGGICYNRKIAREKNA